MSASPDVASRAPTNPTELRALIQPARDRLAAHPLYDALIDLEAIRRFMSLHVWAVYDFMVLLGALRESLAPGTRHWLPPACTAATRAVNEITLAEESDVADDGTPASHFDLYLAAMRDVGADTFRIEQHIERLRAGYTIESSLLVPGVPFSARTFSLTTNALAGQLPSAAAALCYGREQLLPDLFTRLLAHADGAPVWRYYLERHVELDGDVHGDDAEEILRAVCHGPADWRLAADAALTALDARGVLWDSCLRLIETGTTVDLSNGPLGVSSAG